VSEGERLVVPGAAISGGTSAPAEEREPVERAPSVEQRMAPYLATGWVIGVGLWMLRGRRS